VLVNASGIDYPGDSGDAVVAEDAAPGDAFLGHVCKDMGRQADLLLHGQRAVSTKLEGFEFRYRTLRAALEDALA